MKKRKPLKPAFVVTIAAGAVSLAAGGCSGEVITNPPIVEAQCPETTPQAGDACGEDGMTCQYSSADGCKDSNATCKDGEWSITNELAPCNPPMPDCGETPPADGAPCNAAAGGCYYLDACGDPTISATCASGGWQVDTSQACACPEEMPMNGADCPLGVGPCTYDDYTGQPNYTATCTESGWQISYDSPGCNPPPYCPVDVPLQGDFCYCSGFGSECSYVDECGEPILVYCNGSEWEVTYTVDCNPPPPCEYLGQDGCALDPTCVWLTPGCGDPQSIPALPQAGCFSATPCETDANCPIGTCQEVMVEPDCVEQGCDACGVAVKVCIQ